jgi:hypothetical protein
MRKTVRAGAEARAGARADAQIFDKLEHEPHKNGARAAQK